MKHCELGLHLCFGKQRLPVSSPANPPGSLCQLCCWTGLILSFNFPYACFYLKWSPTDTLRRRENISHLTGVGLQTTSSLALSELHPSIQIFKRQILALGTLDMVFSNPISGAIYSPSAQGKRGSAEEAADSRSPPGDAAMRQTTSSPPGSAGDLTFPSACSPNNNSELDQALNPNKFQCHSAYRSVAGAALIAEGMLAGPLQASP